MICAMPLTGPEPTPSAVKVRRSESVDLIAAARTIMTGSIRRSGLGPGRLSVLCIDQVRLISVCPATGDAYGQALEARGIDNRVRHLRDSAVRGDRHCFNEYLARGSSGCASRSSWVGIIFPCYGSSAPSWDRRLGPRPVLPRAPRVASRHGIGAVVARRCAYRACHERSYCWCG